jgi:hypothetical protein
MPISVIYLCAAVHNFTPVWYTFTSVNHSTGGWDEKEAEA